jgi:parvulin-like peptidyl-prolyl isomerase
MVVRHQGTRCSLATHRRFNFRADAQEDELNRHLITLASALIVLLIATTACEGETPPVVLTPATTAVVANATQAPKPTAPPVATPKGTAHPPATATPTTAATAAPKGALTCPPTTPLPANAQLAARVNGVGISLDAFNRQAAQAQAALTQNGGLDPKSQAGQDAIKSLRQQVLDQMINDVVIAMEADREGIKVTDNDVNARLAQMIQDAGSVDKLNAYLTKNQLTLGDLCTQVRNQLLGEAMLNRITAAIPTSADQVHAAHILVPTAAEAQQIRTQLVNGADFASLAKKYSKDDASAANGGDLGWFPKGVMDPNFEAVAFQLKVGEISQVVQTQFGFHIIKVLGHEVRPLPPEVIQNQRQQAFLAWLQAVRGTLKIDRLVQ